MTGPKLHYASQFIIAAMDEWGRPVTPTTGTPVYLKQDYDALQAKVSELEERLTTLKQQRIKYGPICLVCGAAEPCHLKDDPHSPCTFDPAPRELWDRCKEQKQRISELEERLKEQKQLTEHAEASEEYARAEWTKDLARLADLEATLRQVEEERDQWKKALHSLTPGGSEFANDPSACVEWIRKARSSQHNTIIALKGERDQLRARVGRLEEALRHIAEARWSPRTTASYDEDARYAYPERESYVRQYAQRALEGKEEHGTKSND